MKVVLLSGGVGGARFADGLARLVRADDLAIIVNTGDDFVHWGLHVAPDLDTVMYTLAELSDDVRGWGLADERFRALAMVERYGGEAWFQLGDRDLATHLMRTEALRAGQTLSQVTARLARALGIGPAVVPMADGLRPTWIETEGHGVLPFQHWFVARRAAPVVRGVRFFGPAAPAPAVIPAIDAADVVLIAPSNPWVSIDPILALDGVCEALARRLVVAVSPIVHGRAIKGPLAGMIESLAGEPASAAAIARHYGPLLGGFVLAEGDGAPGRIRAVDIVMADRAGRVRLAGEVLSFAESLL
jgi:LPPG:FO 2-phospho-L-lactate transferase